MYKAQLGGGRMSRARRLVFFRKAMSAREAEVQRPGIRGGKYYHTKSGHIRYGEQPIGRVASAGEVHEPGPRRTAARDVIAGARGEKAGRVTLDEIKERIQQAEKKWPHESNAVRMAVLMHPHVYKVWQKLNRGRHVEPVHNEKWGPGYELYQQVVPNRPEMRLYWNRARQDYYAHSPNTAWDGVRRETYHAFIDDLVAAARGYRMTYTDSWNRAERAGLKLVHSTEMPEGFKKGDVLERASGERVTVVGAEDGVLKVKGEKRQLQNLNPDAVRAGRVMRVRSEEAPAWHGKGGGERRWHVDPQGKIRAGAPAAEGGGQAFENQVSVRQKAEVGKARSGLFAGRRIREIGDTARIFRETTDADRERFWLVHLSAAGKPEAVEVVSQGSLTASIVHPREVYKNAVNLDTKAVAFVHNHPSGNPMPSREDIAITRKLKDVAQDLGIAVKHHVVVGAEGYTDVEDLIKREWSEATGEEPKRELPEVSGRLERGVREQAPSQWRSSVFGRALGGSRDAAAVGRVLLDPGDKVAVMLALDNKNRVTGVFPIAHDRVEASDRQRTLKLAIGTGAAAVVLTAGKDGRDWQTQLGFEVHRDLQERLSQAGIRYLDTVSVGEGGSYRSVADDEDLRWPS